MPTRGGRSYIFRLRIRYCSKFENPTPARTPAAIIDPTAIYPCFYLRNDRTDSCCCRNGKVTPDPGPVFHRFLDPAPGPKEKHRNPSESIPAPSYPWPPLLPTTNIKAKCSTEQMLSCRSQPERAMERIRTIFSFLLRNSSLSLLLSFTTTWPDPIQHQVKPLRALISRFWIHVQSTTLWSFHRTDPRHQRHFLP